MLVLNNNQTLGTTNNHKYYSNYTDNHTLIYIISIVWQISGQLLL